MPTLSADPSFKLFAICCVILSMLMLILAGLTPAKRAKAKKYVNPEDNKVSFAGATMLDGPEDPHTARVQRSHRNLNESLPLFFGLGLIYVFAGASPTAARVYFIGFTVVRVLHAIAYLNALQPWRTIFYALGAFALTGMMVSILLAVSS